jgi:hypothetical protein
VKNTKQLNTTSPMEPSPLIKLQQPMGMQLLVVTYEEQGIFAAQKLLLAPIQINPIQSRFISDDSAPLSTEQT